jgi:hypothetical protein
MRNESTKKEGHDPSIFWLATNWNLSSKALPTGTYHPKPWSRALPKSSLHLAFLSPCAPLFCYTKSGKCGPFFFSHDKSFV